MYRLLAAGILLAGLLYSQASSPEASLQRAVELQQQGDLEGAVAGFRNFLAERPNEVAVRSNLGVVLSRLGRYDEAIAEYRKALEVEPANASISLNLGLAYYKSGRISEAAKAFSEVHENVPDNQQATLLLADCDLRMGQNDKVVALLSPLEQHNANDLAIAYLLGTALIRDNRVEEGQRLVDLILRNGDSAEARFLLGSQIFASGDFPAAVKQFSRAIELNPKLPTLQSFYGQALLNTGDPDAAGTAFQKELADDPNDFSANLYLGEILIQRKEWNEAKPLLERALQVRPDSVQAKSDLAKAAAHEDLGPGVSVGQPGLKPGDPAPEFTAIRKGSEEPVTLAQLRNSGPVVLVFGSYTCPNFRAAAGTLNKLYATFKGRIGFYLVYIREAHSTDDWESTRNEREGIVLRPATNISERQEHAAMCVRKLHLDFPALLDGMNGDAEKAYAAWPSKAYVIDGRGNIFFATGLSELDLKPDQLHAAIQNVSASTQDPQALVEDAIAKQRAGDLEGAVKEYREFLKAHPEATAIHSNLGAALAGLGRFSEAVTEYKTALKQSPSLSGLSLNLALAYYKMGRIGDAQAELVKVHAETPTNSQATLLLADCYLRMGRNQNVVTLLQPVQHDHPDDLAIAYLLGTALIRDNKADQGQFLVDRILRNGDSAEAHLMLGTAKMQVKDFAGARDEFSKAVALNPNTPEVHVLYAQALQATGDPDGALKQFKAELAIDPYNFDSNLAMGVLLRQDEKLDEALPYLNRALNVRPGDMGVRYQIATIALSQGKVDEARTELESIVKEAPQFTEAHVSLATAYYRLKRPSDGNRERQIVQKLTAEAQAKQPGVRPQ
ncbi:MAG TPA: tetratricopeptide repeat protein [Bryobacteraceae bacterium]|jgi:tetratricopeptide (TPR) repeat protein|nr:tetratricopeptide repeat protein [Bryobacteraceae bacterium]